MLVGYMRVSSADDRQSVDLQRFALITAEHGVEVGHPIVPHSSLYSAGVLCRAL